MHGEFLFEEETCYLARIFPIHHLFARHSGWHKNALFMQCPNDLDIDSGNEVCSGLARIDQTRRSICPDITAEQPAFRQLFDDVSFCPSSHGRRISRARMEQFLRTAIKSGVVALAFMSYTICEREKVRRRLAFDIDHGSAAAIDKR